ncbi:hypothetical protein CDN99_25680 [Roseateles aquatilis]|uniref:DNA mismatch repair proteins mutS family domain-containing protein n=1 Tax=Roseateles aquatilis TaxID=431061 RepID=A0A246IUV5_9BURK|nr:hypothetical protein CDN99_25680 [Roseateles aquatilis]
MLAVSGFVQILLYDQLQHWKLCREAFVTMLRASIEAEGEGSERAAMARRVIRELDAHWLVRSPQAAETLNLIALSEYASMPAKLRRLRQRLEALRSLYLRLARREAASGIAALLRRSGAHCRPEVVDEPRKLAFHALGNPLIPGMAPIPSLMLQGKGAFITGQNGVGKSTLLRSVGVNLIAARAFGHCFADAAVVPSGPVMTSLHIEDSPSQGHSLYVAELRRASELLKAARASGTGVVLIDEVFAGTNHLDAVSVAATVLDELSRYAAVLVSSHNVVLAPLLRERLTPLQVVRAGAGVSIKGGILVETNGISLLREHGFGESHVARAQAVFSWLSSFMSNPPPDQAPIALPGRPSQRLTASPTDSYQ